MIRDGDIRAIYMTLYGIDLGPSYTEKVPPNPPLRIKKSKLEEKSEGK